MNHVLVLNQFALPRDQGGGTRHADLFSRTHGWRARIMAGNRNHYTQTPFECDDPMFRLLAVPEQDGRAARRLIGWISYSAQAFTAGLKMRPDVVFGSSPHLLAPLTAWAIARLTGAGYVLEVRDLWPESFVAAGLLRKGSPVHRMLESLERFLVRRADEIVVVTTGWEEHFRSLGADLDHYTVITNGAEPYDLGLDAADRSELRNRFGIKGTTAIFAGAHGPKDGIDLILDAAAQCPDVNFLLIGDGPVKASSVARAQAEHLTNVEFRPPVSKRDLPELLAACDIGIHSVSPLPVFRLGMSPNKLFDYLAAGLPVASNAGEAISGFVPDGACGRVGSPLSLGDSITAIAMASPEQKDAWREAGKSLIEARFSRTAAAASLSNVLDRARSTSDQKRRGRGRTRSNRQRGGAHS